MKSCAACLLVVVGCKHAPPASPEDSHHAAAVLATTTSPSRADWPSLVDQYSTGDGTHTTYRFVYATDAPCKASVVAQSFGTVGCPTTATKTQGAEIPETITFTYDAARHLTRDGASSYDWQGDLVVSEDASFKYDLAEGTNLVVSIEEPNDRTVHALYQVDHGHLVAELEAHVDGEHHVHAGGRISEYIWRGNRLIEITDRGFHTYVEYADDPPHGPRSEETAGRERLAVDHDAAALATTTSVPRVDWPCAAVHTVDQAPVTRTFTYDSTRTTCKMPLEAQALGVVGCPTGGDEVAGADKTPLVFKYNLSRLESAFGERFWWREDLLFSGTGTRRGARFERHEGGVSQGGTTLEIVDGKLYTFEDHTADANTKAKLAWTKQRLMKIEETIDRKDDKPPIIVTTVFSYDCK